MEIILIGQGEGFMVEYGNKAMNTYTDSCGLVIAFFEDQFKAACYHWPGFDVECKNFMDYFKRLCQYPDCDMLRIVIITNGFFDTKEKEERIKAVRKIKREFNDVETLYYVFKDHTRKQTPLITLSSDGSYIVNGDIEKVDVD